MEFAMGMCKEIEIENVVVDGEKFQVSTVKHFAPVGKEFETIVYRNVCNAYLEPLERFGADNENEAKLIHKRAIEKLKDRKI
jgi:hypothetical protein